MARGGIFSRLRTALAVLLAAATLAGARPVNSGKTLVIVDEIDHDTYADYFDSLRARGYELQLKSARDEDWQLTSLGSIDYDNLVLLPSKSKSLGVKLTAKELYGFLNAGGNVFAVTSPKSVPESVRDFAAELDIHISPRGYQVVDHFGADDIADNSKHVKVQLTAESYAAPESIINPDAHLPFVYEGTAAYLGNNELVLPLLSLPSTSYVFDARSLIDDVDSVQNVVADQLWVSGSQGHAAAGFQTRSNSRFVWIGSNELFTASAAESAPVVDNLTKWVFQEKSVVKPTFVHHYNPAEPELLDPSIYKVSEYAGYQIGIVHWNGEAWAPYIADDVVLEFTMLDPYYRIPLTHNVSASTPEEAVYTKEFQVPDQYGMFTFRTNYQRPGLSFFEETNVVTVRHTANDEWPRSWEITNSWVYLTSAGSVVAAWLVFVVLYLYSGTDEKAKVKKTQ